MNFSELSLAVKDTGLSYDAQTLTLYGDMRGFGVTVSDGGDEYILKIYADSPHKYEKSVSEAINSLAQGLPKNAVNAQRCDIGFVEVRFCRDFFLQENLPELFDTANAVISVLIGLGVSGAPAVLPERPAQPLTESGKRSRVIPDFDFSSVKGLFGALIGAAAMVFIASSVIKVQSGEFFGSLLTEAGIYVIHVVSTILIFFDYRFLARKLDAFGVFVCAVLSVACAVLSSLLVSAKAYSALAEISVSAALADLGGLYESFPEASAFCIKYSMFGVIMSVLTSIISCIWYFGRHPEEMIVGESFKKSAKNSKNKF